MTTLRMKCLHELQYYYDLAAGRAGDHVIWQKLTNPDHNAYRACLHGLGKTACMIPTSTARALLMMLQPALVLPCGDAVIWIYEQPWPLAVRQYCRQDHDMLDHDVAVMHLERMDTQDLVAWHALVMSQVRSNLAGMHHE